MDGYDIDPCVGRYALAIERIRQIPEEDMVKEPYKTCFRDLAGFIMMMDDIHTKIIRGEARDFTLNEWQQINHSMYADILPEHYDRSWANPDYAVEKLGEVFGHALCFLYAELRGLIGYVFEDRREEMTVLAELYLELYAAFSQEELPKEEEIHHILYWFCHDYCELFAAQRVRENIDPEQDFAVALIRESDLHDLTYLYRYGEYVTENQLKTAEYLNTLDEEEIEKAARTFTEGYRIGFIHGGKDLTKKLTVNIRYELGFERLIRCAIDQFAEMGLKPVIFRCALSSLNNLSGRRIGYMGEIANPQYDFDHREDMALYLDRRFMNRRLEVVRVAYEAQKELAEGHAGPAVLETFGQEPFSPAPCESACHFNEQQRQILTQLKNETAQLTNRYIPGEERSFTIMALPVPQIGEQFEAIFHETMKLNTLDNATYEQIHQYLIDELDKGESVHIVGRNGNHTDLTVAMHELADPFRESNFENCVADVNIPVGEVFTSPKLEGTDGVLHVTKVFLDGLEYTDLEMTFKDGMIADYHCSNFADEAKNKEYIKSNVLMHHDSLPMGEFAIGTNTAAYVMANRYDIAAKMPILIAEKTGPHFAVGDTCYSWEEDMVTYNPDGKAIVARDNSITLLRKEDPARAYFNCHTDITIPYSELGLIEVNRKDGTTLTLLRDGRFVLPGTEELNRVLDEAGM